MKISDTTPLPLFLKQPYLFYQPLHCYGKNLTSPFFWGEGERDFEKPTLPSSPFIKAGGSIYALAFSS